MSDNHLSYERNRSLRELLARHGIRHLFIEIRRPQTNGKVERYHQTLKREWALGHRYRSSDHRARALPPWLRHYGCRSYVKGLSLFAVFWAGVPGSAGGGDVRCGW
jgi:transposase InsO family protein